MGGTYIRKGLVIRNMKLIRKGALVRKKVSIRRGVVSRNGALIRKETLVRIEAEGGGGKHTQVRIQSSLDQPPTKELMNSGYEIEMHANVLRYGIPCVHAKGTFST